MLANPIASGTASHVSSAASVMVTPRPLPKNRVNTAPVNPISAEMSISMKEEDAAEIHRVQQRHRDHGVLKWVLREELHGE
jgi:hypothetical protein